MAAKIESAYEDRLGKVKLIGSGGGCFELSLDGKLLYSKLRTGSFPDEEEMVKLVGEQLG